MGNCITTIPPKVVVLGASGFVGKATLSSLVERHGSKLNIYAGVRDPGTFQKIEGVNVVQADMGKPQELTEVLKDFDRVFIVTPGHEDRTKLVLNALDACKNASVEYALILSIPTVETDTIFGKQCKPIEQAVKKSGLRYSIIRLPLFIDNHFANTQSIKEKATFSDPRNAYKLHTPVAVSDVGKASADLLAKPKKHYGKIYTLVMPPFNLIDFSKALSKAIGKQVLVTTVTYEQAKVAFVKMGFPEWQAKGVMDLYRSIDAGKPGTLYKQRGDIKLITGEPATTMEEWVAANSSAFK
mmetsp:Transcript_20305/g.38459  ORF Transcript_20305/g.38459 Transcript_20305/m.38459 type:complete len:298 (-) Transcript_20305:136-1029(-)|eukprot:scaffold2033_cov164-Amphora_coffeaeformis.AAC.30